MQIRTSDIAIFRLAGKEHKRFEKKSGSAPIMMLFLFLVCPFTVRFFAFIKGL